MPYFEQKTILCLPGGHQGGVSEEPIEQSDILGNYKGDFTIKNQGFISTKGKNPVYFNREYESFMWYNGIEWVQVPHDNKFVFGKIEDDSKIVWLGNIKEIERNRNYVSNYGELVDYFNNISSYNPELVYFYFDNVDINESDTGMGGNVKKVIRYIENIDNSIQIVDNKLPHTYINKAVTFDGYPFSIDERLVRLAGDDEFIVGSIVGYENGKLEIAVDGFDVKFINGTTSSLKAGSRIIGMTVNGEYGFVKSSYVHRNATGRVVNGGISHVTGKSLISVAIRFGA